MWFAILYIFSILQIFETIYMEIKLGDELNYIYETSITKCGKQSYKNNKFSSKLKATVKIALHWENIDKSHYQTSLSKLYELKISNVEFPKNIEDKFMLNVFSLDSFQEPLYFHTYDNQISPVIVSNLDSSLSVQIKKSIASLFQLTGHNMTERDTHHDCQVLYNENEVKHTLYKTKICHHPAFSKYTTDRSSIKSYNMKTISRSLYVLNFDKSYFRKVTSLSTTLISSHLSNIKVFNCSTRQSLKFVRSQRLKENVIYADSLNEALLKINPKYMVEFQGEALKFEQELPVDNNFLKISKNNTSVYENFIHKLLQDLQTSYNIFTQQQTTPNIISSHFTNFMTAVVAIRKNDNLDFLETLFKYARKSYPLIMPLLVEVLLTAQTNLTNSFVFQNLFNDSGLQQSKKNMFGPDSKSYFARGIIALSHSKYVDDEFLENMITLVYTLKASLDPETKRKKEDLMVIISIVLWQKCNFNFYCLKNQIVKENLLNSFYRFLEYSWSDLLSRTSSGGHLKPLDIDTFSYLISSTSNVKTIQSAILLTRAFERLFAGNNNDMETYYLLKGLATFPCSLFKMKGPKKVLKTFGFFMPEGDGNDELETLSILNRGFFRDKNSALVMGEIFTILLRCDNSYLFTKHAIQHMVYKVFLEDKNFVTFLHLHQRFKKHIETDSFDQSPKFGTYTPRTYSEETKEGKRMLRSLFPYFLMALSSGAYSDHFQNNINLGFTIANQDIFNLEINSQSLGSAIERTTSFFSAPSNPSKLQPRVSLQLMNGQFFLPRHLHIISSDSDIMGLAFSGGNNKPSTLFNMNVMIQDLKGAFSLANGFPVYITIMGMLNVQSDASLEINVFGKSYQSLIKTKFNFFTKISSQVFDNTYVTFVDFVSRANYPIITKGKYDSKKGRHSFKIDFSNALLSTNYSKIENFNRLKKDGSFKKKIKRFFSPIFNLNSLFCFPIHRTPNIFGSHII
ncbi:uncharacterized protein LOC135929271 isoform X2 [Gordionus sp. m RMFG-2023]|uniref:uncharacterized protein LOC135929271 isoform X2 n=1 Tax=Gordionus sp. m RMFG-2023 TaxID=3053472 RepID=UPI0031FDD039